MFVKISILRPSRSQLGAASPFCQTHEDETEVSLQGVPTLLHLVSGIQLLESQEMFVHEFHPEITDS